MFKLSIMVAISGFDLGDCVFWVLGVLAYICLGFARLGFCGRFGVGLGL